MSKDLATYQQLFDLLKANSRTAEGQILSKQLSEIISSPEGTFQLFDNIRESGNPGLFSIHRTSYLRAAKMALNHAKWNPEHVPAIIELTNWLISLEHPYNSHYAREIRIFVNSLENKLPIPQEQNR